MLFIYLYGCIPSLRLARRRYHKSHFSMSGLPLITSYGKSREVWGAPVRSPCVVLCLQGPGPRRYRAMQVRHMCVCIVTSVRWYIVCKYVGNSLDTPTEMLDSCFPFTVVAVFMGGKQSILLVYFFFEGNYALFLFSYLGLSPPYARCEGVTSIIKVFLCNLKALCHFLLQWVYPILAHGA